MTTKTYQVIISGVFCILCAAGTIVWTGCDASSATDALSISPETVTVGPGDDVVFTVSGGYEYTWSLSPDDGSAILSTTKGSTTTYTCLTTNVGTTPKTIVVTSTIQGSGGGTSNSTAYAVSGTAKIYYKGGIGASTIPSSTLSISLSSSSVKTNAQLTATASGGTAPYSWIQSSGSLSTLSGTTTIYTAPATSGSCTLTVTDSASSTKSATITITN